MAAAAVDQMHYRSSLIALSLTVVHSITTNVLYFYVTFIHVTSFAILIGMCSHGTCAVSPHPHPPLLGTTPCLLPPSTSPRCILPSCKLTTFVTPPWSSHQRCQSERTTVGVQVIVCVCLYVVSGTLCSIYPYDNAQLSV